MKRKSPIQICPVCQKYKRILKPELLCAACRDLDTDQLSVWSYEILSSDTNDYFVRDKAGPIVAEHFESRSDALDWARAKTQGFLNTRSTTPIRRLRIAQKPLGMPPPVLIVPRESTTRKRALLTGPRLLVLSWVLGFVWILFFRGPNA